MIKIQLACACAALILMASPASAQPAGIDRPMTIAPGRDGGDSAFRPKPENGDARPDRQTRAETRRAWEEMTREWEARQRGMDRHSRDGTAQQAPGAALPRK